MKCKIPAMTKGRIKAVRGLMIGMARVAETAHKAKERAEEKHGPLSDEYAEANAQYDEAKDTMKRIYRLLKMRLDELERPFGR